RGADARFERVTTPESHDLTLASNLPQVRPLTAGEIRSSVRQLKVQIAAHWRLVVVAIVRDRCHEHAPDLNAFRTAGAGLQSDFVDERVEPGQIAGRCPGETRHAGKR